MCDKPNEDDLRKLRKLLAKGLPEIRAMIRKQVDAIEKATHEGTLDEFAGQLRGECAKCGHPPVVHVTEVSPGTGEVKSFDLCEEHAREYRDKLPPRTNEP